MLSHRKGSLILGAAVAALALLSPVSSFAYVEDFSGQVAGTVVTGTLPQGGTASGTLFPNMTISVVNNGGGPQTGIIFDSANPTGNDPDLGSPNQTCPGGGVGVGVRGEVGQSGENCDALGNLIIVAENINDADLNDIVDNPDDEAGGGEILIEFDAVVTVDTVTILDIDNEVAAFTLLDDGTLVGNVNAGDLGDNSAQTLDLSSFGPITCLKFVFTSSCAVAEIEYTEEAVPTEKITWGGLKTKMARDLIIGN